MITAGILVLGSASVFARPAHLNRNSVRVRAAASTEAEILTTLHNGTRIEVLSTHGDWHRIRYNSYEGYIYSDFVNFIGGPSVDSEEVVGVDDSVDPNYEDVISEETHGYEYEVEDIFPKTVVTLSSANIHIKPSLTSLIMTEVAEGSTITVNRQVGNWSHILYGQQSGWIRNFGIENSVEIPTDEDTSDTRLVTASFANIRAEANTTSNVVGTVSSGVRVTILGRQGDWYQVEFQNLRGYILSELLSEN